MVNYIRNLNIRLKLYVLIGVALLGLLIIGGMSFILMGRMNSVASDISTSWLPSVDMARDMSATLTKRWKNPAFSIFKARRKIWMPFWRNTGK